MLAQKEFEKLQDQATYAKSVEPCEYYFKFIASMLTALFTLNWYVTIGFTWV
jgi:hypothetical protein